MNRTHSPASTGTRTRAPFAAGALAPSLTLAAALAVGLAGCATGSDTADSPAAFEPGSVVHSVSASDRAAAQSADPIAADSATLWINGMGCPQCVTNIDLQLERQFNAKDIRVDLAEGKVRATFPTKRPSPKDLARATKDAGLTLVRVASPAQ
jgi:copper chaperone CopZ